MADDATSTEAELDSGSELEPGTHRWSFFRAGGFDQVKLETADDLRNLEQLNQKLWVALSCPTTGLELDEKTLEAIDADKDGRIRAPDVIAATKWACACLKDPLDLRRGDCPLPLSAINPKTPEGKEVLESAREILANLGKKDATEITLEDTADTNKVFAETKFNGDGVVIPESAEDEALRAVVTDIMACCGEKDDRSGKKGFDQEAADKLFAAAQAYSDWWKEAEGDAAVLPLGPATVAAADAVRAVRGKVDDYFARCRLAAFDPRAQAALNREEKDYLAFAAKDLSITTEEVTGLPVALADAGRPMPLRAALNPAWADRIARLRDDAVAPLLGPRDTLAEEGWAHILKRLEPHEAWVAKKAGAEVEKLGLPRVRELLAGKAKEQIADLVARDKAVEPQYNAITNVDKLIRYYRDLHKLLVNFVNFRDFYGRKDKAIFQLGTLYLDQRSCDLCVRVDDMTRHGTLAHLSRAYLAYCDCVRKAPDKTDATKTVVEKMTIAAAFTAGDADNLIVGRNGIFYDRKGQDWDATITKLTDNPISIRQAFWSPYKRLMRWIEDQVAKRATAADTASHTSMTGHAGKVLEPPKPAAPPAKPAAPVAHAAAVAAPPAKSKFDVGVVAALGVAVGGITAALGMVMQSFFGLGIWMPLGLVGLMLAISLPSMVIAWLKLRQRNIGPILDANGWAVNAKAKINIPFGGTLTGTAKLPKGSKRDLFDPYKERHTKRNVALVIIGLLALGGLWYVGALDHALPTKIRAGTVFKRVKPEPPKDTKAPTKADAKAGTKAGTKAPTKVDAKAPTKVDTKAPTPPVPAKADTKAPAPVCPPPSVPAVWCLSPATTAAPAPAPAPPPPPAPAPAPSLFPILPPPK
jgi:hypothetical protein